MMAAVSLNPSTSNLPSLSDVASMSAPLSLSHNGLQHTFAVDLEHASLLAWHRDLFLNDLGTSDPQSPQSATALALRFLQYLLDAGSAQSEVRVLLSAFEHEFLASTDIHNLALRLPDGPQAAESLIKTYYSALSYCDMAPREVPSALFKAAEAGQARVFLAFGGQGIGNLTCLQELRKLYSTYGPLLDDLINAVAPGLLDLSRLSSTNDFYTGRTYDLLNWLRDADSAPDQSFIACAAISFPIVGLLGLAHYAVMCKVLGKTPGEMRHLVQGVTGHSQGIVVAAGIAQCDTWQSFYDVSKSIIRVLFWMGFHSHQEAPRSALSDSEVTDSVEQGEGRPSFLLSVRGLQRAELQKIVDACNKSLAEDERVYLALANSRDNFTVAGPARSLRGLSLHLRKIKAADGADQSRVPFSRRKKVISSFFLPISAPFHSPYLQGAASKIKDQLSDVQVPLDALTIPVYHTASGKDLRSLVGKTVTEALVDACTCEFMDWPASINFPNASHVIVLGSKLADLVVKIKQGDGVNVIPGVELSLPSSNISTKADLFAATLPAEKLSVASWGEQFRPGLVKTDSGELLLDTKLSRILGTPPVITAGMTPTTVHWDFVAAVINAGYHVEMAGGGYFNAKTMSDAIQNVLGAIPAGKGITCNLIYASPESIRWQIALLGDLRRKGLPIDGLTIGAGVPSPDIAAGYITTLGLKHIGFKPGSIDAIKQTLEIADAHPSFPIILQWTGGRGGGHHSYEDFHTPILGLYADIRKRSNVILVAGSGFGDAEGTYPYLTGEWAHRFGYPSMPFDGILLGSRMMVAKEAHTSPESRKLIVDASGVDDPDWEKSYTEPTGGVITVQSEMGQPIHKLATRGVRLWAELDKTIFSLPRAQRPEALAKRKDYIISRLNADFAKPWFGIDAIDRAVDLSEMTYAQVLARSIALMYVPGQKRWIDPSYMALTRDVAQKTLDRIPSGSANIPQLEDPSTFVVDFIKICPASETMKLHPEDLRWFVKRCKDRTSKPVNFVPVFDEDFEFFFKKDSLWQSEDIDAVYGQDAGRVCILQSPVSVRYSQKVDESAKEILDGINTSLVAKILQEYYGGKLSSDIPQMATADDIMPSSGSLPGVEVEEVGRTRIFRAANGGGPDADEWLDFMGQRTSGWVKSLFSDKYIVQGRERVPNPFRRVLRLRPGESIEVDREARAVAIYSLEGHHKLCSISSTDGIQVSASLSVPSRDKQSSIALSLDFTYKSSFKDCSLFETGSRTDQIKSFYANLWLPKDQPVNETARSTFYGGEVTLTDELVKSLRGILHSTLPDHEYNGSTAGDVPLDIAIVLAWEPLVKPLLIPDIQGDLLRLVHRSNKFEYCPGATTLEVGDTVKTTSTVQAVTIEEAGKSVVVVAVIERGGKPVVTVTSEFFFRGVFSDFERTFKVTEEPEIVLEVASKLDDAVLRDREWLILDKPQLPLINRSLIFALKTEVSWKDKTTLSKLKTEGLVFSLFSSGQREQVGKVSFEAGECRGNPVMDFLTRKGTPLNKATDLKAPGWSKEASKEVRMPKSNFPYANFSLDNNPIHVSPVFASFAGLPGTITHGMCTSAVVRAVIQHLAAEGDNARFRSYTASFVGMVLPGDILRVQFSHRAMSRGRMVLKIQARKDGSDDLVLEGEAEIDQAPTVYVFTGQGSQSKGMGMGLYQSSPAAKKVWDDVDSYLKELYGWSILDIVKDNPKEITVNFGGKKGRQIRDNYLAMTIETTLPDGSAVDVPILKGLTSQSPSYTFYEPRGLLFSTQFAQPAITLLEKAAFEDMRSKSLVQEGATFAGHSLGEYGSLAALAEFMPFEALASVVFYRGLTMQVAMERDESGRTEYSMAAVNPGRVARWFNQTMLSSVVDLIAKESNALLEIVNLNVEGEQYVCAGKLQNLHCLTEVLNHISKTRDSETIVRAAFSTPPADSDLRAIIAKHIAAAEQLPRPIELARGVATIPLKGIDVPFHSSFLRNGVQPYRKFLTQRIQQSNVNPENLVGKFIPNVMAKPFSLERAYVEEAARLTGSPVLGQILGTA